jgi:polyhydroxybutyrate depolymerase
VTVANDHIYTFPTRYDGTTPMPLVIGLHANGNPNTQLQGLTNGTRLETNFVRAFPKSTGAGWVIGTDASRITAVYNDLLANYCIDASRAFLTGHSSGAQMVVQLLCASGGEMRFKAVAPVAASRYCASVAPIPAMYIQGMRDAMRGNGNGIDVVTFFTSSNMCAGTTVPDTDVPTCNSALDGQLVTPGCVAYQGCSRSTIWCSHNDNSYNATDGNMHGWPCFASNAMADFFLNLP